MRLYLEVPYNEKESLKKMASSAGWDSDRKQWYVSQKADYNKVIQWIPNIKERSLLICDRIYIIEAMSKCHKCKKMSPTICFGLEEYFYVKQGEKGPFLSKIKRQKGEITLAVSPKEIGDSFKTYLQEKHHFYWDYSKTVKSHYFANHCVCGGLKGDFFLYVSRQNTPFYLNSKRKVDNLNLKRIELSENGMSSLRLLNDENDTEMYLLHMEYPILGDFIGSFTMSDKVNVEDVKDFKIKGSDI